MDEIKPVNCGCGGKPVVIETDQWDSFEMLYTVCCDKCKIMTEIYTDEKEAIEAWNKAMSGNVQECAKDARCTERIVG